MQENTVSVQEAIQNAADALRRDDKRAARHWAQIAASAAPQLEEPWLILAAVSSSHAAIEYLKQALLANPGSERAMRGLRWAQARQGTQPLHPAMPVAMSATQPVRPVLADTQAVPVSKPVAPQSTKRASMLPWLSLPALVLILACLVAGWALWPGSNTSALALIRSGVSSSLGATVDAPVVISSPTNIPTASATATALPSPTPTLTPFPASTATLTPVPTEQPTLAPTTSSVAVVGSYTIQSGDTLFSIASRAGLTADELAAANGISRYATIYSGQVLSIPQGGTVPAPAPEVQPTAASEGPVPTGGKRILVSISQQHLYAYEGDTLVYSFIASTGMNNSTRVGQFEILDKIPNAYGATWNIWMPNWMGIYYAGSLEDGIHALPILSNGSRLWAGYLGTPISFGCIVLGVQDAQTLYDWAEVGTTVEIQR